MDVGALCGTIGQDDRTVDDVAGELFDDGETELDVRASGGASAKQNAEMSASRVVDDTSTDEAQR